MKRLILLFSILFIALNLNAQNREISEQNVEVTQDTIPKRDTLSFDKLIYSLGGSIICSDSLKVMMGKQLIKNKKRTFTGYRIRIFFDNKQNARVVSEQISAVFSEQYPSIPVYREHANPYFKVSVGNFRTKSDAMKFLNEIKDVYPSAFLVREAFSTI